MVLLIYVGLLFLVNLAATLPNIVCSHDDHQEECNILEEREEYKCMTFSNKLDCLINIDTNKANVGTISPDEALLANPFVTNINVIANTAPVLNYADSDDELIVLIKNEIKSFKDLKDLKMCHPGYGKLKLPRYYLNKFDETVLDNLVPDRCDENLETIVEKRYYGLSQVFGDSCYPGQWAYNKYMDIELKDKYKKLNDACRTTNDSILDPFKEAVNCFLDKGDIALTTYNTLIEHKIDLSNYYIFCKNGTSIKPTDNNWCSWGKRPKHMLVANPQHSQNIQNSLVFDIFNDKVIGPLRKEGKSGFDLSPYLNSIVFPHSSDLLLPIQNKPLNEFLAEKDTEASPNKCDTPIKWCTISPMEQKKCLWFKQATINQGIVPTIECCETKNQKECIEKIKEEKAHIMMLNNSNSLIEKYDLVAIGYAETTKQDLNKSMIVLKDSNANQTLFKRNDIVKCLECTKNRNDAIEECLSSYGHFEVIFSKDKSRLIDEYANYTILCNNGSLANYRGLEVDHDCYLSMRTHAELVVLRKNQYNKNIIEALNGYEVEFGPQSKSFRLFETFNGTKDLLFEDSTIGFSYNLNYKSKHEKQIQCYDRRAGSSMIKTNGYIFCLSISFTVFLKIVYTS